MTRRKPRSWGILYGDERLDPRAWGSPSDARAALSRELEFTERRNIKHLREARVVPVSVGLFKRP